MSLVGFDVLLVCVATGIVNLSLAVLLLLQIHLVPVHDGCIIITALLDLVGKLRMFVRDLDLLLKALLFIVKFTKAILKHLSL